MVVPFPFSDLTEAKRRPALVITGLSGDDLILCQVTSRNVRDRYSISLTVNDFTEGSLTKTSNIRPNRIFTADRNIVLYKIGSLKKEKVTEVISGIIEIIRN